MSALLAQLSTIKARIGIDVTDMQSDALLELFLRTVSARFAAHCNRSFERQENATEEFEASLCELAVSRYPIESVSEFAVKTSEVEGWQALTGVGYMVRRSARCIISLDSPQGNDRALLQVTYTGGYVLPGGTAELGQQLLPDDIEGACIEQVVYVWQNRNRLGMATVSGEGGSIGMIPVSVVKPFDLLPSVKNALENHVRWRL